MNANRQLIGHKMAGVIMAYADLAGVPIRESLNAFYRSYLYTEISNGLSDMHCRADGYLAEELRLEIERDKLSNNV